MQTYQAIALGREGVATILYSWTWVTLHQDRTLNYVCLVDGVIKEVWGEHHPVCREWNGMEVLDVSSTNIKLLYELTPLMMELL